MFKIIDNPDTELREIAEKALQEMKNKYGKRYCPCGLEQIDENICPCEDFKNQDWEGECNCGRYEKVKK